MIVLALSVQFFALFCDDFQELHEFFVWHNRLGTTARLLLEKHHRDLHELALTLVLEVRDIFEGSVVLDLVRVGLA